MPTSAGTLLSAGCAAGTAALLRNISKGSADEALAQQATELANEVDAGIREWGVVTHSSGAKIFAMEVDGFGIFDVIE